MFTQYHNVPKNALVFPSEFIAQHVIQIFDIFIIYEKNSKNKFTTMDYSILYFTYYYKYHHY